jgi:predicted DNA binding CopG/RHH family protein
MTPLRSIRVPDELWQAVKVKANANGFTVTKIVIYYLKEYLKD